MGEQPGEPPRAHPAPDGAADEPALSVGVQPEAAAQNLQSLGQRLPTVVDQDRSGQTMAAARFASSFAPSTFETWASATILCSGRIIAAIASRSIR